MSRKFRMFRNKMVGVYGRFYSAASIAQMPVPVPMSRILCGLLIGARVNLSSNTR